MKMPTVIALAGGEGTRLYPLTLTDPKPLIPICNRPIVWWMFEMLARDGCRDFVFASKRAINAVRLKESFKDGTELSARVGSKVRIRYQPNYDDRGNADAVRFCMSHFGLDEVLVMGGDNLFELDLKHLLEEHRSQGSFMTICLKEVEDVSQYGVAELDGQRIKRFVEKPDPSSAPSNLANTSIYLISKEFLDVVEKCPREKVADFGGDLIPYLVERYDVNAVILHGYWNDVGNPSSYIQTCRDVLNGRLEKMRVEISTLEGTKSSVVGSDCIIGRDAYIEKSCIGDGCIIGNGCEIVDSVILDFVRVGDGTRIEGAVVGKYTTIGEGCRIIGGEDVPVIGGDVILGRGSVVRDGERIAPVESAEKILSTGKYEEISREGGNFKFRAKKKL